MQPGNKVLVVEDNPTQAELARVLVTGLGHEVRVVGTAHEALEAARAWRPAAMLLDVELPDFDGFELLRRLRAESIVCAVVVLTANASMEAAKEAIRAGAADYLVKPFRRDRLAEVLSRALAEQAPSRTPDAPPVEEVGPRVLVVEDNPTQAELARALLRRSGHSVRVVASAEAALPVLAEWRPDLALIDVGLPGMSGIDLLRQIAADRLPVLVIVITAHDTREGGVEAIRLGAFDYIAKPYDAQRLAVTVRNALHQAQRPRDRFYSFIGAAPAMQAVYSTIESVATSKASVFITGESGTGKELAADAVHRASPRAAGPFVALNCGAIPRDLLESEVFGHVRGAFTGATTDRTGAARLADGGTLFLDEICEMPLDMQVKLLRFVQTGTFQPVGSGRTERVDVRFVCATNRDPQAEVQAGRFREDLFYRLYVVPISLPPLRARGTDVLLIARHFLTTFAREERKRFRGFDREAEQALLASSWPGNVRQLQNVVRNIVVLHDFDRVRLDMLPPLGAAMSASSPTALSSPPTGFAEHFVERRAGVPEPDSTAMVRPLLATPIFSQPSAFPSLPAQALVAPPAPEPEIMPLAEMERRLILAALRKTRDDVPRAAALLQINPSTIYRKLQSWRADGLIPS
jgi:two-component system repressor protein LuxO